MKNIEEAIKKVENADPVVNAFNPTRRQLKDISPSVVTFTPSVADYFNNRAIATRGAKPTEEFIKNRLAFFAREKLGIFFNICADHPDTGPIESWKVEEIKVDFYKKSRSLLFALIFKDEGGNGDRWLVLFTFDNKNNPIYIKIETKYFDLNSFPMQKLEDISASGGYKHNQLVNTVAKMTEKQLVDNIAEPLGREGSLKDFDF
jgi:hypothetical protein